MIDPVSIVILTGGVLVVLLVVLAVIAAIVLAPAVRRSLAERAAEPDDSQSALDDSESAPGHSAQRLENDDRGGR
ncbi:hypothetical protein [Microcella sp.]|uniref:hypothetical protein n=1 Tax=Microcella sp. TaxID=1913979 RepID=UPI00299F61C8|nr:hypothetical protein [Microcella sp.]MDX2026496.1 hypothetical protein [Microcella sp.]